MKKAIVVAVSAVTAASAIAASVATADSTRVASPAAPNCKLATIALTGPYTGPAGGAGLDQRNWGRVFLTNWNAGRAIPGVPRTLKRTKLKAIEADTQLNPQVAATVAVQLRSNRDVLAANAFSGSQENVAGGPILRRGGMSFVSGSATRASLTDPSTPDGGVLKNGFFRRVVPHDNIQAGTDVTFMRQRLNVGAGDTVMVVDQAEAYSVPLANRAASAASGGQHRGRPSISAGGADRLHVARQQGGRPASGGGLLRIAGRLERAAVLPAAQVTGLHGRVLRHGRHVRLERLQGAGRVHLVVQPRHQRQCRSLGRS